MDVSQLKEKISIKRQVDDDLQAEETKCGEVTGCMQIATYFL